MCMGRHHEPGQGPLLQTQFTDHINELSIPKNSLTTLTSPLYINKLLQLKNSGQETALIIQTYLKTNSFKSNYKGKDG